MRAPDRIGQPYTYGGTVKFGSDEQKRARGIANALTIEGGEIGQVKAWELPPPRPELGPDASVARWIVEAPGHHAAWDKWVMYVIHLRDLPGMKPAHKRYPEAAYEFVIAALEPGNPVPYDGEAPLAWMTPIDAVIQFHKVDDAGAARLLSLAVDAIVRGDLSPDSDYRRAWEGFVATIAEEIGSGRAASS